MRRIFAALVGLAGCAAPAAAETPVAVVEEVSGPVTGAEFMDYVAPGKVIKLGPAGTIVLGYMKSCRRETITGVGTVIIGKEESMVHLGEVKAARSDCDSGHAQAVKRETGESAAMVVRSYSAKPEVSPPEFTLYGLSPVFETAGRGGKLLVERLDVKGERYDVDLAAAPMLRGKFYDFAKAGTALTPGGTYAASLGTRKAVFLVDPRAAAGAGPIVGRLVRIE
jgi:hypothetical protein